VRLQKRMFTSSVVQVWLDPREGCIKVRKSSLSCFSLTVRGSGFVGSVGAAVCIVVVEGVGVFVGATVVLGFAEPVVAAVVPGFAEPVVAGVVTFPGTVVVAGLVVPVGLTISPEDVVWVVAVVLVGPVTFGESVVGASEELVGTAVSVGATVSVGVTDFVGVVLFVMGVSAIVGGVLSMFAQPTIKAHTNTGNIAKRSFKRAL